MLSSLITTIKKRVRAVVAPGEERGVARARQEGKPSPRSVRTSEHVPRRRVERQTQPQGPPPPAERHKRKKKKPASAEKSHPPAPPSMGDWKSAVPSEEERASAPKDTIFFEDLPIHDRLLRAIREDLGFSHCTPIQGDALSPALEGRDVAGMAHTGTGKTAAFLITIFHRLLTHPCEDKRPHVPRALILAPTRELAIQIDKDATKLGTYCGVPHLPVYGGMGFETQQKEIRKGVDVVTATPGRQLDYARRNVLDLSKIEILVIDEADRMMDMGFMPDLRRIVAQLPAPSHRQTMLFSATLPPEIVRIASRWMTDPVRIEAAAEEIVADGVHETVYAVSASEKLALLLWLIRHEAGERILIFRNRRRDVENLYHHLKRYDLSCAMLTGDVPQKKRLQVLERFRKGEVRIIVATDVAGRGIHVENISHVVNYDLPYDADDYVHRVGRTGRAGKTGRAVSFACEQSAYDLPDIEEYIGRQLPTEQPSGEMIELPPPKHKRPEGKRQGGKRRGNQPAKRNRRGSKPRGRRRN